MTTHPPVLGGCGAVSGAGDGVDPLWELIRRGESAIGPAARFDPDPFPGALAALAPGEPGVLRHGLTAAREALAGTDLELETGWLVLGTTMGSDLERIDALAADLGRALGLGGPLLTISTACCSSTAAIGLAAELVETGVAPWALAGGAEELGLELYAGFRALGVLACRPCTPLGEVMGTTLGEGAGFVVVRPEGDGPAVLGSGTSSDAHHATTPHPRGRGVRRAVEAALAHAGVPRSTVGFVSLHGTGTAANDHAECLGVVGALGAAVPASSTKGHLGHAQAAAGVLELLVALEGRRRGQMPPTLGCDAPRPRLGVDPIPGPRPRAASFDRFVALNAAFGGANAALVLGAGEPRERERRPVYLAAVHHEVAGADLGQRFLRQVRGVDPHGLDPSALLATLAVHGARPRRRVPADRRGITLGSAAAPSTSLDEFRESIRERGIAAPSASAFGRLVLHAPAGAASRLLGMRGPTTTVSMGRGSGLLAVALSAHALAWRDDADALVAVSLDEGEGAIAFGLTHQRPEGPCCRVSAHTIERGVADVGAPLDGARALAEAFHALCTGAQRTATVTAGEPGLGGVRLTIEREG